MADSDGDEALAWAARRLSWECRLRELESDACDEPAAPRPVLPEVSPKRSSSRRRRAGSRALAR